MKKRAIITQTAPACDWQPQAADYITDLRELLTLLVLPADALPAALQAQQDFPTRVPRSFVARMEPGNPNDPLLRQVLALGEEMQEIPNYVADPLDEAEHTPLPGILHKYHGRVLLMATGACAINCRYCFRRHFPYQEHLPTRERWAALVPWLQQQNEVQEVILSGGDPLSLSDRRLQELISRLQQVQHLKRLRIHTRLPVVMPERVSETLLAMLAQSPWPVVMVLHINHPAELSGTVPAALQALTQAGVRLYNQSVLLAGVNDDAPLLAALSERLFELGIQPYYLHALDKVAGAAHFAVDEQRASAIVQELHRLLPGFLLPRWVREEPGAKGKTLLMWDKNQGFL